MIFKIFMLWLKSLGLFILLNMGFGLIVSILSTLFLKKVSFKSPIYYCIVTIFCICFLFLNLYCYGYFLSKAFEIFSATELTRINLLTLYLPLFISLFILYQVSKFSISKTEEQVKINFILTLGMRLSVGLINLLHLIILINPTLVNLVIGYYKSI